MKITKTKLKEIIKEEMENIQENSRLDKNQIHILFKKGFTHDENPGDRTIVGLFSSPDKYQMWFKKRRLIDPDFNRDDYDLVAYKLDVV
tara:strand:- start:37 stop:303 length:267 start_codon:yes stop_codon:yes gene_type:complete